MGLLAGMLICTGNAGRAEELLQKLQEEHQASQGFFLFHLACGEPDQAADGFEKLIEQRSSAVGAYFRFAQASYPSPRWAAVATKMNLPE